VWGGGKRGEEAEAKNDAKSVHLHGSPFDLPSLSFFFITELLSNTINSEGGVKGKWTTSLNDKFWGS
jgi:hypothetical protein